MKKTAFGFIAMGIASAVAPAQSYIANEDFEGAKPTLEIGAQSRITDAKDEAIGGSRSLLCDAANGKDETAFEVSSDKFNVFEVSFNYKTLNVAKGAPQVGFIDKDGKYTDFRSERPFFLHNDGDIETFKALFHGRAGQKCTLRVCVSAGGRAVFDNVKVRGFNAPAKSDWAVHNAKVFASCRSNPFKNYYLKADDKILSMSEAEFFPFIDKYGQYKHRDWTDKVHSDADLKAQAAREKTLADAMPDSRPDRDKYFGFVSPDKKFAATGKFRTQKIDGKWWFITPDGNPFFAVGACKAGFGWSLNPPKLDGRDCEKRTPSTPIEGREKFFENPVGEKYTLATAPFKRSYFQGKPAKSFNYYARNIDIKYGNPDADFLAKILARRAKLFGVNLGGHLSEYPLLEKAKVPYTVTVYSAPEEWIDGDYKLHGWWQLPPDWFSPKFEKSVRERLAECATYIKSAYCFGVFVDGELPWVEKRAEISKGVLSCGEMQSAKIAFWQMLEKKYKTLRDLNDAWGSKYESKAGFLKTKNFFPTTEKGIADLYDFEELYTRQYFKVCRDAIKNIDKDAMYLGCSFGTYGSAWEYAAMISADYCEVVTANIYRYNISNLALPAGSKDRPILIGEYHFTPYDGGTFGITMVPVETAENQALCTLEFMRSAAHNPAVAGIDWFAWFDLPATGRYDKADSGIGLVDMADTPHYKLVETFKKFSEEVYKMRFEAKGAYGSGAQNDRNWH